MRFYQIIIFLLLHSSCASYEKFRQITEGMEIPSLVFNATYNQTWQAIVSTMSKYDIAVQNQEGGFIKTRWMDNTLEVNFADSFGASDTVKAAKYKIIINVVKGYRSSREVTKVSVYKRQLIEKDFLQGWKEMTTDGIFEKTLLYRIQQLITIDKEIKRIEKIQQKEILENSNIDF